MFFVLFLLFFSFLFNLLLVCILVPVTTWGSELNIILLKFHHWPFSCSIARLLQIISSTNFPQVFISINFSQEKNRIHVHTTMCSHLCLHWYSYVKTWYHPQSLHVVKLSKTGILHLAVPLTFSLTLIWGYFEIRVCSKEEPADASLGQGQFQSCWGKSNTNFKLNIKIRTLHA